MYYVISLHLPDQRLIEVILVPMVLSALHSDDLGGSYGLSKVQYLEARCCGPVGRRWFPESWGSPRPAALPRIWEVLSPPRLVG